MNSVRKILTLLFCFILVVVVLDLLVVMLFDDVSDIDVCLDMGGAWNYDMKRCKYD